MFSKDEIEAWIDLATTGINKMDPAAETINSIKLRVLEAKVMTDRWGHVATDIVVHSSHKGDFIRALGLEDPAPESEQVTAAKSLLEKLKGLVQPGYKTPLEPKGSRLWGANVHYSDNIPEDVGLVLVLEDGQLYDNCAECFDDGESEVDHCVAVFTM